MDRLAAQLLAGPPATSVRAAVERVVAVQAQSMPAARLAVRARTTGLTAADVDRALASGELVRSWLLRGTLHLVTAADFDWLHPLVAPRFLRAGRRRREQLGLDDATCGRALDVLPSVLAPGEAIGRLELVARLAGHGVRIDPSGQAPVHLVAYAALSGLVSCGPADEVMLLPSRPSPLSSSLLMDLGRRFVAGYGSADPRDFTAWSGLPSPALAAAAAFPSPSAAAPPRLLGQFDSLLLGYRDRSWVVPPSHARQVNAGGGMIAATVLAGGVVAGTWRRTGRVVTVTPFSPLAVSLQEDLADLGRFLGFDLTLSCRS